MRTQTAPRDGPIVTCGVVLVSLALVAAFVVLSAHQLGWIPDWMFGPGVVRVDDVPRPIATIPPPPPIAAPAQAAPAVPTAYIPVQHEVQYQAAPPADVPIEQVQPKAEIVNVQRSSEQTVITRTIPQKPAGAPIVIDKGEKRRSAP